MNPSTAQNARAEPTLVSGAFVRMVNGIALELSYAYMAAPATIWDGELIAWANGRDAELQSRRAATQSAEAARPGGVSESPLRSASAAGAGSAT